jgi:acetylornithine deacetylase
MELLEMVTKLVGIGSESSISNRPITDFIHQLLLEAGFDEKAILVKSSSSSDGVEKCSIIARKGQGSDALMLAGHTDTVSAQPQNQWHSMPLELTKRRNRLYGLGVADMKLFLAAAIKTAELFSADALSRPLVLVFTCDEEIGLLGAKQLKRYNLLTGIRFGVVGEPTQLCPVRLHKGYISAELIIHGQSGHGSRPKSGINAIEKAHEFIGKLLAYREELDQFHNDHLDPIYPTLNIGAIHAGAEANKIPGECRLKFEIRPIPGQTADDIVGDLHRMAEELGKARFGDIAKLQLHSAPTEPMETLANSRIVQVAEKVTGKQAVGVSYSTEATIYNSAGLETIILGPGDIAQIHQPDEYVQATYLETTVTILQQIVADLCLERK